LRTHLASTGISCWYFCNQALLVVISRTSSVAPVNEFWKSGVISNKAPSFSFNPSQRQHSARIAHPELRGREKSVN